MCMIFVFAYHFVRGLFAALAGRGFRTKQVFFSKWSFWINMFNLCLCAYHFVAFSQLWPDEVFPGDRIHSPVSTPFSHTTQQHTMCYRETQQSHNKEHCNTGKQCVKCEHTISFTYLRQQHTMCYTDNSTKTHNVLQRNTGKGFISKHVHCAGHGKKRSDWSLFP